ncbi:hypothetical protein [Streptomyces sp. NPDC051776]|uniref:hypothetical protein n=1 Tax=Streptomyces sp. NPDC051776 TaxID=3155414 RepID=UPI00341B7D66
MGAVGEVRLRNSASRTLHTYLNDHLAGATAGVELARRMVREYGDSPFGNDLKRLAAEIDQDRQALLRLMFRLEVPARRYKIYGAWVGEKVGRLKPNGRILRRSRISPLLELEALQLGVSGKFLLWESLSLAAADDPRLDAVRLQELLDRARHQLSTLTSLRNEATATILAPTGPALP